MISGGTPLFTLVSLGISRGTPRAPTSPVKLGLRALVPVLVAVPFANACSSNLEELGESSSESALTSGVDCSIEQEPAYSGGQQIGTVDVVRIGEKRVSLKTAHAFLYLQKQAEAEGIDVSINSGFRTMSEQQHFYDCYQTKSCNNGNLAARPGYSNHQNGRALDLGGDRSALNRLIERLGLDWRRTVSSEPWHYEYYGPFVEGPCGSPTTGESTGGTTEREVVTAPVPTTPRPTPTAEPTPTTPRPPPVIDENADPYDRANPYDPYRTQPQPDPYGGDPYNPYGTNPDPYGTNPNPNPNPNPYGTDPYGTDPYANPNEVPGTNSAPGSVPVVPGGTPAPPGGVPAPGTVPSTTPPGTTAPAPAAPQTPVMAAPEAEGRGATPPVEPTPPLKKKNKAKPKAVESGCSAVPIGTRDDASPFSLVAIAIAAAFARRRRS